MCFSFARCPFDHFSNSCDTCKRNKWFFNWIKIPRLSFANDLEIYNSKSVKREREKERRAKPDINFLDIWACIHKLLLTSLLFSLRVPFILLWVLGVLIVCYEYQVTCNTIYSGNWRSEGDYFTLNFYSKKTAKLRK